MGLFGGCEYLETRGGIFSEYVCKYSHKQIDNRSAQDICMTNRYQECVDYKNAKGCFITTAVILSLGKPDDCDELQTIRKFRDTWLRLQPDGEKWIYEYKMIAPLIVKGIDSREDSRSIYSELYKNYIQPCVELIRNGYFHACFGVYKEMVNSLRGYAEAV